MDIQFHGDRIKFSIASNLNSLHRSFFTGTCTGRTGMTLEQGIFRSLILQKYDRLELRPETKIFFCTIFGKPRFLGHFFLLFWGYLDNEDLNKKVLQACIFVRAFGKY